MAPSVTSSPWAKLINPVSPKMSDSPIAHIAMIRPNLTPFSTAWASFSPTVGPPPTGSPSAKISGRERPAVTVTSSVSRSGSRKEMPSGSVVVSIVARYVPGPGRSICQRPSLPLTASPIAPPAASTTEMRTPSTGSPLKRSVPEKASPPSPSWACAEPKRKSERTATATNATALRNERAFDKGAPLSAANRRAPV